ncbi:transportin-3 [Microplitis demolitor]|uniref:transportin-3 n=1 Tax=Microplitis demolitor TaxID=69319 RepID=UPI0004CCBBF9|nr:transportin-3 [Microplitis demolitor]
MMDVPPEIETVYEAIYSMHKSSNSTEQHRASLWLQDLQKTVYAWKISDRILQEKKDLDSCFFAAQTMRAKIQYDFHELPAEAHTSLRDSLIGHISQIDEHTSPAIVCQLCLALADLALQMPTWHKPVIDLINRFGGNTSSLWPLLELIKFLPEETNTLSLGANRRDQVLADLSSCADTVSEFLKLSLKSTNNTENIQIHIRIIKCLTSWITVHAVPLEAIPSSDIIAYAFQVLGNHTSNDQLHEAAADCVCSILQSLQLNNNRDIDNYHHHDHHHHNQHHHNQHNPKSPQIQRLQLCLFTSVIALEQPYHLLVAEEETGQLMNYCRIFTEFAETFLVTIINECTSEQQHYAIKILDLVLMCVGHHDYEVAQITFNLWYQLSEELYQRNSEELNKVFKPYIERLISALCKHCQMEPDYLGLLEQDPLSQDFSLFRSRVSELIKDVVFIIGSSHCFRQMFSRINGTQQSLDGVTIISPTWDSIEASLFIMQSVAKNILPEEDQVVPEVVEAILNVHENTHIAVKHTSILLLGELCEWINSHARSLEPILNFLLVCLSQDGLASVASGALHSICTACPEHMASHFPGLLEIARCLDGYPISNDAAIGLLKGVSIILARLPREEITRAMKELCWFQVRPLCALMELTGIPVTRATKTDPVFWLDRLAAIFRHTNPSVDSNDTLPHPCRDVVTEIWPVLSRAFNKYSADSRIMERCCRCVRHAIRCIRKHAVHLLEDIVKLIVGLYATHQHSCFLYLGSILVDEYATDHECAAGLVQMLEAFIGPTFTLLQEQNGLKHHPDTVDDLFRLCSRFIQRAPIAFLHSAPKDSIVDCALSACSLDHKDANASVMKFLYEFLHSARNNDDRSDFTIRRALVQNVLNEKGQTLVTNLLHAAVFSLPTYMLQDTVDVIIELTLIDQTSMAKWLEEAIKSMPTQNASGSITATPDQLYEFHRTILKTTDSPKTVMNAVRTFARLFR